MRSEKPPEENELDVLDGYVLGRLAYVIDHLESYQGLDGKGGVIVHPPSKRKFEWAKSIREIVQSEQAPFVTESYQILRCPFYQYFHGINSDIATQEIALEALENWILPRVEVIREELNCLIGLLKSIGRKRVAKLERMQKDLEESEPFIWDTFVTHFEQSVKQEARSAGLQFEKQA
ncbi:MAG: hypothetical protein O2954_20515, partial [bacterium]|nr:hypothetical protein [bacterium]